MVCLGFEAGAAEWKAPTNPLSYGGTPTCTLFKRSYLFRLPTRAKRSSKKITSASKRQNYSGKISRFPIRSKSGKGWGKPRPVSPWPNITEIHILGLSTFRRDLTPSAKARSWGKRSTRRTGYRNRFTSSQSTTPPRRSRMFGFEKPTFLF